MENLSKPIRDLAENGGTIEEARALAVHIMEEFMTQIEKEEAAKGEEEEEEEA